MGRGSGGAKQSVTEQVSELADARQARSAARRKAWAAGEIPLAEVFGGAVADNWGAVVVLAVPVVALGVVLRHDFAWGDVPTWVVAGLTLLAFGAAAFAGVVAYDLLRIEGARDVASAKERATREDADRRAQASKVAAWYGSWGDEATAGMGRRMPYWQYWGAIIRNASDLPVYDVRVTFCVAVSVPPGPGERWDAAERYSSPEPIMVIPPISGETAEIPADVRERETADGNEPRWLVGILFTDADGRRWFRAPTGQLRPL